MSSILLDEKCLEGPLNLQLQGLVAYKNKLLPHVSKVLLFSSSTRVERNVRGARGPPYHGRCFQHSHSYGIPPAAPWSPPVSPPAQQRSLNAEDSNCQTQIAMRTPADSTTPDSIVPTTEHLQISTSPIGIRSAAAWSTRPHYVVLVGRHFGISAARPRP